MQDKPTSEWVYRHECMSKCGWRKDVKGIGTGPKRCPECKSSVSNWRVDERSPLSEMFRF